MIRYVKSALTATVLAASFASSQAYAILDFQGLYGFSKLLHSLAVLTETMHLEHK